MIHHLENETYHCFDCDQKYDLDEVNSTWKCPECDSNISICANINSNKYNINRIKAYNVKTGDTMMIGYDYYPVLNVEEENNKKIKIALKGYRVVSQHPEEFVNCIIGSCH